MEKTVSGRVIELVLGDITRQAVDAIGNLLRQLHRDGDGLRHHFGGFAFDANIVGKH